MVKRVDSGRAATYADLEALPEHVVGEIVCGRLVSTARPAPAHAHASSSLGILVGGPFQFGFGGPGGWRIIMEPELHLGPDVLVPDLAGCRLERMPDLPETAYFPVAPDWVCEVLSLSTEALDRGEKLALYQREQVAHVWLLNPVAATLEVMRLRPEGYLVAGVYRPPGAVRVVPFDAVELELGLIFGEAKKPV